MLKALAVGLLLAGIVAVLGVLGHASPLVIVLTAVLIAVASISGDAWRRSRRKRLQTGTHLQ